MAGVRPAILFGAAILRAASEQRLLQPHGHHGKSGNPGVYLAGGAVTEAFRRIELKPDRRRRGKLGDTARNIPPLR
jgi:hypothetical protein